MPAWSVRASSRLHCSDGLFSVLLIDICVRSLSLRPVFFFCRIDVSVLFFDIDSE